MKQKKYRKINKQMGREREMEKQNNNMISLAVALNI